MKRIQSLLLFSAVCFFTLLCSAEDGVVRILGVGNSFTVNSMKFIPKIVANDPEIKAEIGGAIIGGCPLDKHVRLAKEHEADPSKGNEYRYTLDGANFKTGVSLKEILLDRKWDYVTIQQLSTKSYKPETYTPYTGELLGYIRKYAPQAEIVIHETWSHSVNSYRNTEWKLNPDDMYDKLHAAYAAISKEYGLRVIPVGTAFQNARATPMFDEELTDVDVNSLNYPEDKDRLPELKNSLNHVFSWRKNKEGEWFVGNDGFHANHNGEYLGGLVWYGFFFEKDPRKVSFQPSTLTDEQAASLRDIAHQTLNAASPAP